jgi:hypothetical protein
MKLDIRRTDARLYVVDTEAKSALTCAPGEQLHIVPFTGALILHLVHHKCARTVQMSSTTHRMESLKRTPCSAASTTVVYWSYKSGTLSPNTHFTV